MQIRSYKSFIKIAFILTLLTFILYGNTLWNQYSMDDNLIYLSNPVIEKGISGIPVVFKSHYVTLEDKSFDYRPIVKILTGLEVLIFGYNTFVGHLINVFLYALCLILLYSFLKQVFSDSYYNVLVMVSVLIFAFHPVHTEVVASLKNRDELLSFIFTMCSALFFFKWNNYKKWFYYVFGIILFVFAMISKSSAIVFAAIIPFSIWFVHRIKLFRLLLVMLPLLLVVIFFYMFIIFILPYTDRAPFYFENPLFFDKSIHMRIGTAVFTILHYIKLLIIPIDLKFYYGYNSFPIISIFNVFPIVGLVILIIIAIYTVILVKKNHPVGYGLMYFFLAISMFSNLIIPAVGIVADRFAFNASVGYAIILGYSFLALQNHKKTTLRKIRYALIIILILFAYKTISRNKDWNDTLSLYSADVNKLKHSMKANLLYGNTLFQEIIFTARDPNFKLRNEKYLKLCIYHLNQAAKIYPQYPRIWNSLGAVHYMLLRDFDKAKTYFKTALKYDSTYVEPLYNLGFVYENIHQPDSALYYYHKCLFYDSMYVNAYTRLVFIYQNIDDTTKSYKINKLMIKNFPALDVPYILMGNHYFMRKDTLMAVQYWEKALELGTQNTDLLGILKNYYILKNDKQKINIIQNHEVQVVKKQKEKKKIPRFL